MKKTTFPVPCACGFALVGETTRETPPFNLTVVHGHDDCHVAPDGRGLRTVETPHVPQRDRGVS